MPRGKEHLRGKAGPRAEESIFWRHRGTEKSRRRRKYAEDAREAKTTGPCRNLPSALWQEESALDTEEREKLNGSQPDCPPPKWRCTGSTETQKCTHGACGSGNLHSSSPRERNSPADGRSSGGETVHGLSSHRGDSHPGSVAEQQPRKYSLEQRALPPVPVHPEAAGSCQANAKQTCRKRKHSCAEGDEIAPKRKRRETEASILVIQN